jgi:manganese/iron transport system permease protein
VVAMLVAPGATAFLVTRRFERMLIVAAAVAIVSSVLGTLVSFHINGSTGPCIVLIQAGIFVLALLRDQVTRWRTAAPAEASSTQRG